MVSIFQVPLYLSLLTPTSLLAYSPVPGLFVPLGGGKPFCTVCPEWHHMMKEKRGRTPQPISLPRVLEIICA